jgi:hypothetical protein
MLSKANLKLFVFLWLTLNEQAQGFLSGARLRTSVINNVKPGLSIRCSPVFMASDPESEGRDFITRFTNPVLDDPSLPLTDVLMAQIVAPSLQVFWIRLLHSPSPSWLQPVFTADTLYGSTRGSLLAPTLIHGAGLSCCWLLGALAAKAYERKSFDPTTEGGGYGEVLVSIVKAGAFASGALIFATQLDLLLEYGRWVQPGESPEIDVRLLSAIVELLNDIIFEAIVLTSMRLYLAVSNS